MDNTKPKFDLRAMRTLLRQIAALPEEMLSCADTYALLDEYVDRLAQGEPVDTLLPAVKYHLEICGNCGVEFEMLRAIILGAGHE